MRDERKPDQPPLPYGVSLGKPLKQHVERPVPPADSDKPAAKSQPPKATDAHS